MSDDALTRRQEEILRASAISLSNDSDDNKPQHPQAAWGERQEDYFDNKTDEEVERELTSYDRTDAADDN